MSAQAVSLEPVNSTDGLTPTGALALHRNYWYRLVVVRIRNPQWSLGNSDSRVMSEQMFKLVSN